ncbi:MULTISPECIES: hypothetical protein [Frankia]|nr:MULTISPECIES: hypothetical protein [Frankia]
MDQDDRRHLGPSFGTACCASGGCEGRRAAAELWTSSKIINGVDVIPHP